MAEFPALPLFTDALTADTSHLSDDEFGRYVRLLILCWRLPNCKMPRDEVWHIRRHRVNSQQFNDLYKTLLEEFFQCDGNWYYQKRLLAEFSRLRAIKQKNTVSANSRWNKEKDLCERNATLPIPIKKEPPTPLKKFSGIETLPEWLDPQDWKDYLELRKSKKAPNTERALNDSIADLKKLKDLGHSPKDVISQSIKRGWTGLFAIKPEFNLQQQPKYPENKKGVITL